MNRLRNFIFIAIALVVLNLAALSIGRIVSAEVSGPMLMTPENGEHITSTTPKLEWVEVGGLDLSLFYVDPITCSYQVEIIKDSDSVEVLSRTTEDTCYDVPYTLTGTQQPLEPFTKYRWRVSYACQAGGMEETGASAEKTFTTGDYPWICNQNIDDKSGYDQDCDGIPNEVEEKIGTGKEKKTLFVRPIIKESVNGPGRYWRDFIETYFPQPSGSCKNPCLAAIPPFEAAGVEVVVIGCDQPRPDPCPLESYRPLYAKFADFDYNPTDPTRFDPDLGESPDYRLPCKIMDVVAKASQHFCEHASDRRFLGHTHLSVSEKGTVMPAEADSGAEGHQHNEVDTYTWTWATLGYTVPIKKQSGYHIPSIYPIPIHHYFVEGAYTAIENNGYPATTNCSSHVERARCGNCTGNATSPCFSPNNPDGNQTVEFSAVIIPDESGRIGRVFPSTPPQYNRGDVIRRMIVHEMGHALLNAESRDHCDNPDCILYGAIENWELAGFGTSCGHFEEIREPGVILNLYQKEISCDPND